MGLPDPLQEPKKKLKAALLGRLAQEVSSGCGKNVEEDGLAKTGRMAKQL